MKRFIAILMVIQLSLLAGCSIPFFGKSTDKASGLADGQQMLQLPENDQLGSTGSGISGNPVSSGTALTTTAGALAAAIPGGTTTDSALAATVSSAAIGAAADGVASSLAQESQGSGTAAPTSEVAAAETVRDEGDKPVEAKLPVTVYYQDGDGYLVPMTRWIQQQQGIARAAVSLTVDSAMAREEIAYYGVYPVIPADTKILGIDIRDGIATIDFDRHLLNYDNATSERNIIASVVYTMTEFKTVDKVRILINGYPQEVLKFGTNISMPLGREEVAVNSDVTLPKAGSDKVDLYFMKKANAGFTYMVPISVVNSESSGELPEILVKNLLKADPAGALNNEIPEGVTLLKDNLQNGVLTLDFSENFTDYGGSAREEGILKQLAYTVRQVDGIHSMKILVNGSEAQLPEGTDISDGVAIPATVNDVMDR